MVRQIFYHCATAHGLGSKNLTAPWLGDTNVQILLNKKWVSSNLGKCTQKIFINSNQICVYFLSSLNGSWVVISFTEYYLNERWKHFKCCHLEGNLWRSCLTIVILFIFEFWISTKWNKILLTWMQSKLVKWTKKRGKTLEFCPQSYIVVRFCLILFATCGPMLQNFLP